MNKLLLGVLLAFTCNVTAQNSQPLPYDPPKSIQLPEVIQGKFIIKFKQNVKEEDRQTLLKTFKSALILSPLENVYLVDTESTPSSDLLERVEPESVVGLDATPTGWLYSNGNGRWNLNSSLNTFGSRVSSAWANNHTDCSGVTVAVMDTGIQPNHENLSGNLWENPQEIAGNRIDDDGNGLVDDKNGWNFVANNSSTFSGTYSSNLSNWTNADQHGTHVSGIIGGNDTGLPGMCWKIKIIPVKVCGLRNKSLGVTSNACYYSSQIAALDYLVGLKNRGENIVAVNVSLGGLNSDYNLVEQAYQRASNAGILIVAAAGNDNTNTDSTPHYPSGYNVPGIISVGAINRFGNRASYSNYGATSVDIFAPGGDTESGSWAYAIESSASAKRGYGGANRNFLSYYNPDIGTSAAAPHVTGAAALYAAYHPKNVGESNYDYMIRIKNAILSSATPTASLNGLCVTGGRLDASGF